MSQNSSHKLTLTLATSVAVILRPLVRILLNYGISYGSFSEIARWVFADVAAREFGLPGKKTSKSRIAILTGLSRKEVLRLRALPFPGETEVGGSYNRASRVIAGWVRERPFCGDGTEAEVLPLEGQGASFVELVRRFSGDVPAKALLNELLRVGAVEMTPDGRIRLLTRAYVPAGPAAEADKVEILGTDVAALIETIGHNLQAPRGGTFFQRKVAYTGIPAAAVPGLRQVAAEKCQRVIEELDKIFAEQLRQAEEEGSEKRVMVGIYWAEGDPEDRTQTAEGRKVDQGRAFGAPAAGRGSAR